MRIYGEIAALIGQRCLQSSANYVALLLLAAGIVLLTGEDNACVAQDSGVHQPSVSIGIAGDVADVQTTTKPGILLMGGSTDVDAALQWMIDHSGGGDFVIIRASGSTGYNDYVKGLGNVNSVETLLIDSREKAILPATGQKIRNAEALFIAGGDQGNYVRFWADTEVSAAIQYLIRVKKIPIGGTSAGCAVLSEYIFDALKGGVTSDQALANPYDTLVSISRSFISIPALQNVIVDQHYSERNRHGRHIVFMARVGKDFNRPSPIGLGIDEKTAVALEEGGGTKIFGSGSAYFIVAKQAPERCERGSKLTWNRDGQALQVYVRKGGVSGSPGINLLQGPTGVPDQHWAVVDGVVKIK